MVELAAAPKRSRLGSNYAWLILLACLGFYAIPVGCVANIAGVFLTPVEKQFHWSATDAQAYLTIFPWVAMVCMPLVGRIYNRYNPRWVLTLSVLVYGLSTIWTAYATHLWQWDVYGVLYGMTAAFFMYFAVPVLLGAWFHKRLGLMISAAGVVLSLLTSWFATQTQDWINDYGWKDARLILGLIVTVIPTVLTVLFVRRDPASMGVEPYGAGQEPDPVDIASGAGEKSGMTASEALRTPALYIVILVAGFLCLTASFFQQIPSYAATGKLGADAGAEAVTVLMWGGIAGKFALGWLSDHVGGMVTGPVAGLCGAVGVFLAWTAGANHAVFFIGMVLFGVGFAGLTVVSPMLTKQVFGEAHYAAVFKWVTVGLFLFSGLAPQIYSHIYDSAHSYTPAFILVIILYAAIAVMVPIMLTIAKRRSRTVA